MTEKCILVVDDQADILDLMRDVLAGEGYTVDTAQSAQQGLALIMDRIYDAAILDYHLPDMDGVRLHQRIRQMDAELAERTIFMSGLAQSESNLDYYAAQTSGFLAKPFQVRDMLEAVRAVLKSAGD